MTGEEVLQIDVKGLIAARNPKALKRIPGFVIRYLERIVHQDEINDFLRINHGKKDIDFINVGIEYMDLTIKFDGLENIPVGGRYVFASNHPLGGLESLVLMQIVNKKFDKFVFVVNDLLMAIKPVNNIFVPVNKLGGQSRESVRQINEAYESDKQILYFPAGLVSRKIKGKIMDPPWQKAFVSKSVVSKRSIVPVFIEGRNSNFFYRLAKMRKFFGIKTNIEMLYLANEMFKQKGRTITVSFGKPLPYTIFDKSKSYQEWALYLQDLAYSLKS